MIGRWPATVIVIGSPSPDYFSQGGPVMSWPRRRRGGAVLPASTMPWRLRRPPFPPSTLLLLVVVMVVLAVVAAVVGRVLLRAAPATPSCSSSRARREPLSVLAPHSGILSRGMHCRRLLLAAACVARRKWMTGRRGPRLVPAGRCSSCCCCWHTRLVGCRRLLGLRLRMPPQLLLLLWY